MQNLYKTVKEHLFFNKFVLDDLVCIEYSCPVEDEHTGIFAEYDYIIHVLSGKKTWTTVEGSWAVNAGETLFVKKGAAIVTQHFDDDFCMLGFFMPDDLIKNAVHDIMSDIPVDKHLNIHEFTATMLNHDQYLEGFFQSMLTYFEENRQPPASLLKLKLKELLINILFHCKNPMLIAYLKNLVENRYPSLTHIMETNYCYNLKLEEFALMSHRSLSTFKRDFFNHYNTTPGKWLTSRRLKHAAALLMKGSATISEVAFDSGFENVSHFSKAFKKQYNCSPSKYAVNV